MTSPDGSTAEPTAAVRVQDSPHAVRAVVLVLYGGKGASHARSRPRHLSALRMRVVAGVLHRVTAPAGVAVWTVGYRYRGWNAGEASPAVDARWALDEVRRRHGKIPVVIVGHSMGGRAALRVGGDPSVVGVVALAPWLPVGEPVEQLAGQRLRILHATRDRWTDPRGSLAFALRARAVGADVRWVEVARAGHFMARRAGVWHALTRYLVLDALAIAGVSGHPDSATTRTGRSAVANTLSSTTSDQPRSHV